MKKNLINAASLFAVLFCLTSFVGCGPNDGLNPVEGMVTLDGQPIEKGTINMGPMVGQSGTAVGGEIINGVYKVRASEGEMVVTIRSQKAVPIENPTADEQAHGVTERIEEQIPAKYNQASELKFTVVKGKNVQNFELVGDKSE